MEGLFREEGLGLDKDGLGGGTGSFWGDMGDIGRGGGWSRLEGGSGNRPWYSCARSKGGRGNLSLGSTIGGGGLRGLLIGAGLCPRSRFHFPGFVLR